MSDQTFQQLWTRLLLYAPELPVPLAQEFVNTAYSRLLSSYEWSQLKAQIELRIPVAQTTTLAAQLDPGDTTLEVAVGALSNALSLQAYFQGNAPFYTLTSLTSGATDVYGLDFTYQGESLPIGTAVTVSRVYADLPSDFGEWDAIRDLDNNWRLHINFTQRQLDVWDANRSVSGTPWILVGAEPRSPIVALGESASAAPILRNEIWPRVAPGPKRYLTRYTRRLPLLSAATDRPIRPVRGDVIRKGALAELAIWPGTANFQNPYFSLSTHEVLEKEFQQGVTEIWKWDQNIAQTAVLYEDWEGVPYAPIDARYLQTHDVF